MVITENFLLDTLKQVDAVQLHQFMNENKERLEVFFPVTLSSNATLEKTKQYIEIKTVKFKRELISLLPLEQ